MAKTVLNVKTDVEVKKEAQDVAKELGLPLSTIVNAYLKDLIRNRSVTFSVDLELKPEAAKRIDKALEDSKKGVNISPEFSSVEEMDAYLDAL